MKAINKTYSNIDDPDLPSTVMWDMADDDGVVVVPELITVCALGDKSELTNLVNKVVRDYEKGL